MSTDSPPSRNLTSWFNKKFLQFAQSTGSSINPSIYSPRHHRANSSPTYMSPTKSQMERIDEEFVIGCSVCGTKAIEETCFAENPILRNSIDDPNSGAYARIVAYYEKPLDDLATSSIELKSIANAHPDLEYDRPFEVAIESKHDSPVVKKIVYKEFSPPAKNPLTPLNYGQKQIVKECFYENPTAKQFVKEEERKIVVSRRTEYVHRSNGQVKTFVRTDTGQNKSKMVSRNPSEAGFFNRTAPQKIEKKKKNSKNEKDPKGQSHKGYSIKIHSGQDSYDSFRQSGRVSSESSEMIMHFELPKSSNKDLKSPRSNQGQGKSSPNSKKASPMNLSFSSNKSSKDTKQSPRDNPKFSKKPLNNQRISRSISPSHIDPNTLRTSSKSKNPSRSLSPAYLKDPKSQIPKIAIKSPHGSGASLSPANSKSPSGSKSSLNSPRNPKTDSLDVKFPSKSPSGPRSPINQPTTSSTFLFPSSNLDTGKNIKTPSRGPSPINSPRYASNSNPLPTGPKGTSAPKGGISKGKTTQLRSSKPNKPPPLPKLFEPRNLNEFFYIQLIAATKIQRAYRLSREYKKTRNIAVQWEDKYSTETESFDSDQIASAIKLLCRYGKYVKKTGRKFI